MQTHSIRVEDIQIGERHRALADEAVQRLAGSMSDIGLRQPISIRIVEEMMVDGDLTAGVPVLVAGAHRLAAAKSLGWSHIDCIEVDDDVLKAELWEIAENLHRHDLTKDQRDEHIRRYAEVLAAMKEAELQSGQVVHIESKRSDGRGHRQKEVAAQIAEETGLSQRTVRRALNPPAPRPQLIEVKDAFDVVTEQADAIVRAWNRACPEARQLAMEQIDGPVMDRTRAGMGLDAA